MSQRVNSRLQHATLTSIGLLALIAAWAAVAATQLTVLVPSPAETLTALVELGRGPLWSEAARTSWRAARGTGAATVTGILLGLATGSSVTLSALLTPARSILTGVPPIITVVLVAIWIGLHGDSTPIVVAIATTPIVWITTAEAVRAVDPELREMAAGLNLGWFWKLRHVTGPAIGSPVRATVAYVAATSLRLTIMAELLAEPDGIGARIARARTTLDTPEVFAWALVAIAAAVLLESTVLRHQTSTTSFPDPDQGPPKDSRLQR